MTARAQATFELIAASNVRRTQDDAERPSAAAIFLTAIHRPGVNLNAINLLAVRFCFAFMLAKV